MSKSSDLAEFQAALGHEFANPALLEEALTHPSMSSSVQRHNQRLEFLGDRVLGLVIADALLASDPEATEGELAPRLNALVRKEACADVAAEIGMGPVLRMGRSETLSGGRRKTALLGDAMEAVIAAVYRDAGFAAANAMILRLWAKRIASADAVGRDPKTALQEWAQGRGMKPPAYSEISRRGPDHAPIFVIEVRLDNGANETAEARSKRAAQQDAAEKLLNRLEAKQ